MWPWTSYGCLKLIIIIIIIIIILPFLIAKSALIFFRTLLQSDRGQHVIQVALFIILWSHWFYFVWIIGTVTCLFFRIMVFFDMTPCSLVNGRCGAVPEESAVPFVTLAVYPDGRFCRFMGFTLVAFSALDRSLRSFWRTKTETYLLTYSMEQSPSWEGNWFCS